jgi:hypothetical protein
MGANGHKLDNVWACFNRTMSPNGGFGFPAMTRNFLENSSHFTGCGPRFGKFCHNRIDRLEQEYQKAMKFLDRLEQSTLAKAFRGELVPQDPNDEPASILLERIQKERENQPKQKKRQLSLFKEK